MRRIYLAILPLLGLVTTPSIAAADGRLYLTGKLGSASPDFAVEPFQDVIDGEGGSWGLGVGFRWGDHLAFQVEHQDLGVDRTDPPPCSPLPGTLCISLPQLAVDTTSFSLAVLPTFPLSPSFSVYAKAGFVDLDNKVSIPGVARTSRDLENEGLLLGAGLRVLLRGPVDVFAEYERIDDSFDTASVGLTLGF